METKSPNPLSRFEKRKINYPLLIAAVLLGVVLVAGIVNSLTARDLNSVSLFVAAAGLFAIVLLLNTAMNRRIEAVDDRRFIHWDAAMPELQRQTINVEVKELARQLNVDRGQLTDLLSAYVVAEDLALRQIQQEENLPLMRHVSIGKTPFDGILVDQDLITCIEVSFLVVPDVRQDRIEAMMKKVAQAKKNLAEVKSRLRLRLMLVLVTQLTSEEEERLRTGLVDRRFSDTPVDIDIRLLDFELLQKVYVSE